MTIKDAAQAAIDVQDACNLSGVLRMWREAMVPIFEAVDNTPGRNRHPISVCFAVKAASLAGVEPLDARDIDIFGAAFHACQELVDA